VFGDIGTSLLYTFKKTCRMSPTVKDAATILGVVSPLTWTLRSVSVARLRGDAERLLGGAGMIRARGGGAPKRLCRQPVRASATVSEHQ